jgi:hypothetical protein
MRWKAVRITGKRLALGAAALAGWLLIAVITMLFIGGRCSGIWGCDAQGLSNGPVTLRDLRSHPESQLIYPGGAVTSRYGQSEVRDWTGELVKPGLAGITFSSSATQDTIFTWYTGWLRSHGWEQYQYVEGKTKAIRQGFRRGDREYFFLDFTSGETGGGSGQAVAGQILVDVQYRIQSTVHGPGL